MLSKIHSFSFIYKDLENFSIKYNKEKYYIYLSQKTHVTVP